MGFFLAGLDCCIIPAPTCYSVERAVMYHRAGLFSLPGKVVNCCRVYTCLSPVALSEVLICFRRVKRKTKCLILLIDAWLLIFFFLLWSDMIRTKYKWLCLLSDDQRDVGVSTLITPGIPWRRRKSRKQGGKPLVYYYTELVCCIKPRRRSDILRTYISETHTTESYCIFHEELAASSILAPSVCSARKS